MGISKEEKNWLKKNYPLFYFIIFRATEKKYRFNLIMLLNFIKTASGYLDRVPVDQDSYFDFKDRYYKSKSGVYLKDDFIGENYPFLCQTFSGDKNQEFLWDKWIEDFLKIKDLELSSISFNEVEEVYYYLNSYNGIAYSFGVLANWDSALYPILSQFLRIYKHQELLLRAERDSSLSRRFLPLLNSSVLSFSYIEFARKRDSYKSLIREHLSYEDSFIDNLEEEIPFFPKDKRAISYLILNVLKRRKLKMFKRPDKVFLKPLSFSFSLKRLEILYFYYRVKVLFQKNNPLKKAKN